MNINKLLGLISTIVKAEPVEMIAALQEFVDEVNTNFILSLSETIPMPDTLTYPLYTLDIPSHIKTIHSVWDKTEPVKLNYTEIQYKAQIYPGTKCAYVDQSRTLVFGYSLTADTTPVTATSTITCKVKKPGSFTISTLDDMYIPAAKYFAACRIFAKHGDDKNKIDNYNLYKKEISKVETNSINIAPVLPAEGPEYGASSNDY